MTPEIALTLTILVAAVVLFITERLRVDLVALLVLVSLALTRLVTPAEALSGFSNLAVVTVWAVFILSGALGRTGVANMIGRQLLKLAGESEVRLLVVIMITVGILSGFMNDIGVAALFLPVVIDIARRTNRSPSKLLMPLAFASLLGGLNTLIGTPPNILVSEALRENGLRPFQMFDYTPLGLIIMLSGILFMALIGRHLLPDRDISKEGSRSGKKDPKDIYDLGERLFVVSLPTNSPLVGKTMAESRLGAVLGLNVIAIIQNGEHKLAPDPETIFQPGMRLLVEGRPDTLNEMRGRPHFIVEADNVEVNQLVSAEIEVAEVGIHPRSPLLGQTLEEIDFRRQFSVNVLAIWRDGAPKRTNLQSTPLQSGDILLVQGPRSQLEVLRVDNNFLVSGVERAEVYRLHERLLAVGVPAETTLVGKTLAESRLGDIFGLNVLGIVHEGGTRLIPTGEHQLQAGDTLLVEGKPEDLAILRGLQELEIDHESPPKTFRLESESVGLVEAGLSPHTTLAGKTLRQLHFREKYGLSVLYWRFGERAALTAQT